jgi:hypothetical protein
MNQIDLVVLHVRGCLDCPCNYDCWCKHPHAPDELQGFDALSSHLGQQPPSECPLRQQPLQLQYDAGEP